MENRGSIIGGLVIIGVGVFFLVVQFFPGLAFAVDLETHWPLIIILIGGIFWLAAVLGNPPLAIPGTIISGIGGILYAQNLTGNWESWSYVWALIPAFVGIGIVGSSLLGSGGKNTRREGFRLVITGLVLFVIFGVFFSGFGNLQQFWPVLLILAGGWMLVKNNLSRR